MTTLIYGKRDILDNLSIKNAKEVRFFDSTSTHYTGLKAPASLTADVTLALPDGAGTSGQVLTTNGSNTLSWSSVLTATLASGSIFVGVAGVATAVDTAAQGDITASSTGLNINSGVIINADINAAAAIALSKLAALANNFALVSNGSGVITVSAVTATELGYVSGVTSAIQTQLNNKVNLAFKNNWITADTTTKVITHNLATLDVIVQIYDKTDGSTIEIDSVVRTDTNTLTVTASQAPGAAGWRVLILAV